MPLIPFILAALFLIGLLLAFVLLTDGRYFGKGVIRWIYDRFGPAMFGAHSEADRWQMIKRHVSKSLPRL